MASETDFAKEFESLRKTCLELEEKSKRYEMKCLMLENEVENLKKKNQELEAKIAAVQKDSEDIFDVMVENKVLECEKQKAETDSCILKEKVKELESTIKGMNVDSKGTKEAFHGNVRKRLSFEEDACLDKKMSPSTPGVAQTPFIDFSDEGLSKLLPTRSAKRRRLVKTVSSGDEDSYDDNAPICTLKRQHSSRVRTNSNKKDKSSIDLNRIVSSSEDEEDNDSDAVDGSESEGESLGGFIVNSTDSVSKCDSESSEEPVDDDATSENITLEKIGRKKVPHFKWELEGDMLSDFGKDPKLCMRAVCALYRQQTSDEKESKVTIHQNGRGFSQPDAPRATKLAEFLTDGDSEGDLNKTVEELKAYDSKGIKLCNKLASKYSKQLFAIYQKEEDPYFKPQ